VEEDKKKYVKEYLRRENLCEVFETEKSRYIRFNSQLELEGALRRALRDAPSDLEYSIPRMKTELVGEADSQLIRDSLIDREINIRSDIQDYYVLVSPVDDSSG
jgi:hypothetical protein